jgi:hypothetical protein
MPYYLWGFALPFPKKKVERKIKDKLVLISHRQIRIAFRCPVIWWIQGYLPILSWHVFGKFLKQDTNIYIF